MSIRIDRRLVLAGALALAATPAAAQEKIKFLYSLRLFLERLGRGKELDVNGDPIYTRVKLTCEKNKVGVPGRSSIMYVNNKTGHFESDKAAILELATRKGAVVKSGSYYELNPEKTHGVLGKFHGKEEFIAFALHPDNKWFMDMVMEFA